MRRHVLRLLVVLNVALLIALLLMWVRSDGGLRGTVWTPPAPHLTDFAGQLPALQSPAASDTAAFVAMLERPLFAGNRRPPPPPPPPTEAVVEAPTDNFSTAKLTGIFNSGGAGGIIIRIADKDKRLQLNQAVDGWTLKSIDGRDVTFTKGRESRVLQLQRAALNQAPLEGAPSGSPQAYPFAPGQAASSDASPPADPRSADGAKPASRARKAPRASFGGTPPK